MKAARAAVRRAARAALVGSAVAREHVGVEAGAMAAPAPRELAEVRAAEETAVMVVVAKAVELVAAAMAAAPSVALGMQVARGEVQTGGAPAGMATCWRPNRGRAPGCGACQRCLRRVQ